MSILRPADPKKPIHMSSPSVLGPPHPLPKTFKPEDPKTPHRVRDGETWYTLEAKYGIPAKDLIYFNFRVSDPKHVNFYLQHITGCNRTTDDKNWAFSSSATNGVVYIPPKTYHMEGEVMEVRRSRSTPISQWYNKPTDPDNLIDTAGKVLDVIGAIDTGLAILTAIELPIAVAVGVTALGAAGPMMSVASAHQDAINYHIKEARLSGFSQGLVVGAEKKKWDFARTYFFDNHHSYNNAYPQFRKHFENEYKRAFIGGYKTGRGFTNLESTNFFREIISKMKTKPSQTYGPEPRDWSDKNWVNYFIEAAGIFRRTHLR